MTSDSGTTKRVNGHFDDDAQRYQQLRAGRQFGRRLARTLDFLAGARPDDLVLEIGAGTGGLLEAMADARPDLRYLGVEPLANYVDFARDRWAGRDAERLSMVHGTAERLGDLVDEPARWVVSHDVLHHVDNIGATAGAAAAVSTSDARWLAIEPNRANPWVAVYHLAAPGERLFNQRAFVATAERRGWRATERFRMFLIPHAVHSPSDRLVRLEDRYEHLPVVSGAVGVVLERSAQPA
ncbi:MAG TPA: class I SAM-dependent methyltransferase [Acidimicrobiales bacterium]|nr:class I SAM-dependent methyltransferase [Acidimicrobiales bacterium]